MSPNIEVQNQNYPNAHVVSENIEGGINFLEITSIISRKIPLIVGCTLTMGMITLLKVMTTPPDYVAGFELLSEPVNIETQVTSTDENSRKTREQITDVELDEVQLKILKSPRLISRVVVSLQKQYPDLNYQRLTQGLAIEIISGSQEKQNILSVQYSDPDKQKVTDVVDALNKIYQEYSIEKRQSGVKRGITFLDQQIPQVSTEVEELETKIAKLRTQYNFNNPDSYLKEITSRINQLSRRREENTIKLNELQLNLSNLQRELALQPAKSTTAIAQATPRYLDLLRQLNAIDTEIRQKSDIFADRSDVMQSLIRKKEQLNLSIANAGEDIEQKLTNQISVIENNQQSIAAETNRLKSQLKQWSNVSGQYMGLQSELTRANAKLNEFTSQKDTLQIDAAQQKSPWQLLTPPGKPVTNKISTLNILLLGSTLGLVFGLGLALLLDKHQNIIYTSSKIEEATSLPILGAIPYSPNTEQLSFARSTNVIRKVKQLTSSSESPQIEPQVVRIINPSTEAFRSLAASLGLLASNLNSEITESEVELKSIAVTSAIPREGKSTVALNLARAVASMDKRVLIVDADLRSSEHLTKGLGFELAVGLRNILNHDNPELKLKYVQQLPLEENLFILTAGFKVGSGNDFDDFQEDPSRLLASTKMHQLMEELEQQFDLVIYDLCSIIGFADVNLLATKTDGVVVVSGLGKLHNTALTEALNQLRLCKAPVLGLAVNKLVSQN